MPFPYKNLVENQWNDFKTNVERRQYLVSHEIIEKLETVKNHLTRVNILSVACVILIIGNILNHIQASSEKEELAIKIRELRSELEDVKRTTKGLGVDEDTGKVQIILSKIFSKIVRFFKSKKANENDDDDDEDTDDEDKESSNLASLRLGVVVLAGVVLGGTAYVNSDKIKHVINNTLPEVKKNVLDKVKDVTKKAEYLGRGVRFSGILPDAHFLARR
jgi:hypothetical protein